MKFYTKETIRGIRISPLAEVLPFLVIGWDHWNRKRATYIFELKRSKGLFKRHSVLHKIPRFLFLYYKITFHSTQSTRFFISSYSKTFISYFDSENRISQVAKKVLKVWLFNSVILYQKPCWFISHLKICNLLVFWGILDRCLDFTH